METFLVLLIGLVAGWTDSQRQRICLAGNLIVGVIGALLGGFLSSLLDLKVVGIWEALTAALIGGIVLIWLNGLIKLK
ncbi:MAG: GlsB/YeaQ/YmgE family stress response membrane protein [candidate division KSB1 bacterium]|nr:GlsB/YeaQ/YmgE family stress response membrane protein [candidate division KSB1 bacterium]